MSSHSMLTAENSDEWEHAMTYIHLANLLFLDTCFYLTYFTSTQADRYIFTTLKRPRKHNYSGVWLVLKSSNHKNEDKFS